MNRKFEELAGYPADGASDIGIRLQVLAAEIYSVDAAIEWLKRQSFLETAAGTELEYRAEERGLVRKSAKIAEGTLSFGRNTALWYSVEIPQGTVASTEGGVRFFTTASAVLEAGELSVSAAAKAEEGGRDGNAAPGAICVLVTPPSGIETVTNSAAFSGGVDAETDEELRERLLESCKNSSNGTNADYYRQCALKHDGVYSVSVIPRGRGAGTVDLYLGGVGAPPEAGIVEAVQEEISALRELNVDVKVSAAGTVPIKVVVTVLPKTGVAFAAAKAGCEAALHAYFNALAVGESVTLAGMGAKMMESGLISNYYFNKTETGDTAIEQSQLAVAGEFQIAEWTGDAS